MADELTKEEQAALNQQRQAAPDDTAPPVADAVEPGAVAADATPDASAESDGRQKMVPHAALHEERERRKEAERLAAEKERKWEERFNMLVQKFGQAPAPESAPQTPQLPDPATDPAGYIIGTQQRLGTDVEQVKRALAEQQQQAQQAAAVAAVQARAMAMEREYRSATPDYDAAVTYLADFRARQLAVAGMADPGMRQQQIQQEALGIAHQALQSGRNPAEVLYELAKASGYAPAQAPAAPAPAVDPAQQIERVQRGQQQARSLGNVRGSGPSPMTAQKMLEMSDDDFLKAISSPDARGLMGA